MTFIEVGSEQTFSNVCIGTGDNSPRGTEEVAVRNVVVSLRETSNMLTPLKGGREGRSFTPCLKKARNGQAYFNVETVDIVSKGTKRRSL